MAVAVARAESDLLMIQSRHIYTASNVPKGYKVGDKEESFCIFQIHKPAHQASADKLGYGDYRTNIESCVYMAYEIYKNKGYTFTDWSVYKGLLALR